MAQELLTYSWIYIYIIYIYIYIYTTANNVTNMYKITNILWIFIYLQDLTKPAMHINNEEWSFFTKKSRTKIASY